LRSDKFAVHCAAMNNDFTLPSPLLCVENCTKQYGERRVLDDVHFTMHPGERVAIMGPSGSGKSTLLNCLAGIDMPDSGRITMAGRELTQSSPDERAALRRGVVSTIFQFFHLLPTLSVRENIEFPLQLAGIASRERTMRVDELVNEVGLTHRADARPAQLSGGEMQRVAIARAIVHRPRLILADEPTGNLDSRTGEQVLTLLESLAERHHMALLMVTHHRPATRICSRILNMEDGRLFNEVLT